MWAWGTIRIIRPEFTHSVTLGNNSKLQVRGKSSVRIKYGEISFLLTEIYFVPKLKNNLLSLGQLQEKGLTIVISKGTCKIFHHDDFHDQQQNIHPKHRCRNSNFEVFSSRLTKFNSSLAYKICSSRIYTTRGTQKARHGVGPYN